MQLSQRVQQLPGSATLAVNARVKAMRAEGVDVIGFGAGEPDFDTPENIKQAAIEALLAGQTRYMPVPGEPRARECIARKLREENGIQCTADDIVISVGGKHSIYLVLQCLLDAGRGQEVILPTPAWVSFAPMIQLAGGEVVQVPGAVENDFRITPEQLDRAITNHTVAVILNSPSNPCGTMYTPDDIRDLADVIARHEDVLLISDELYEKLTYGDITHLSPGSLESVRERVVTIGGLGKAYAMTGWRIGYAAAPGDGGMLARAMGKLQSQMTSNITSFCYAAIVEAIENSSDAVETMRRAFAERATLMHELISRMPGMVCPKPTGAFYVFPDISAHFGSTTSRGTEISDAVSFAGALLEEAKVAVVPGDDFGEAGRQHVRLSFACSNEVITEGCRRINQWLESLEPARVAP